MDSIRNELQTDQGMEIGRRMCYFWWSGNIVTKNSDHPPIRLRTKSYFSGSLTAFSQVSLFAQVIVSTFAPSPSAKSFIIAFTLWRGKSYLILKSTGEPFEKPPLYPVTPLRASSNLAYWGSGALSIGLGVGERSEEMVSPFSLPSAEAARPPPNSRQFSNVPVPGWIWTPPNL